MIATGASDVTSTSIVNVEVCVEVNAAVGFDRNANRGFALGDPIVSYQFLLLI